MAKGPVSSDSRQTHASKLSRDLHNRPAHAHGLIQYDDSPEDAAIAMHGCLSADASCLGRSPEGSVVQHGMAILCHPGAS